MLVIESVEAGNLAGQAGIQVGDRLLAYDGLPLPSPAALQALEENTFGRESVRVQIERAGREQAFTVPVGKLGVGVRFELPTDLMAVYEAGQEAFRAEQYAVAAQRWRQAAQYVPEPPHDPSSSSKPKAVLSPTPDPRSPLVAWLWGLAGEAWEKAAEWEKALEAYRAAWEGWQQVGDTAARARTAAALGRCHWNRSEWDASVGWYDQAWQIDQKVGRPMWEANTLNNLGQIARQRGDIVTAQDYLIRALRIRERLAPDSLEVANTLNSLGLAVRLGGDLATAQDYHTRALRIQEQLAPGSLEEAANLNNLGIIAMKRGDLATAQDYYTRSLQIIKRLAPGSLQFAMGLSNLGIIALRRGDLATAQDYNIRALQIRERLAPYSLDMAANLNNLGIVASMRGDLATAQDYYVRALQIKEHLAPGSLDVANSLNNLGMVARNHGNLAAAQDYYIRALQIKEHLAPGSLDVANSLNNLGVIAKLRGDPAMAQDYHTRALQIRERLAPGSLEQADSLTDLGRILLRQHLPEQAIPLLQQSVQFVERQRQSIPTPEARALLLAQHTEKCAALIACYLALQQPDAAFTTLERSRARSLLELLTERRLDFTTEAPPPLLQQQHDLDRQRAGAYDQLAQLSATEENESRIAELHQQLRDLERQQQELTAQIRATSPRYADLQYPQPLTARQAQQALPSGSLLLSYLVDEEQTFLFAVTRKQVQAFILPIGRQDLQQQVYTFRSALDLNALENQLDPDHNLAQANELGHQLYNLLLAPAQTLIAKARRLLLCGDGPLHLLPWSALVVHPGSSLRYLGLRKPLSTTLSMTLYAQGRPAHIAAQRASAEPGAVPSGQARSAAELPFTRRLLALGDPLYNAPGSTLSPALARAADTFPAPSSELEQWHTRGLNLHSLPHTRREVQVLQQLFGEQAQVKLGAEATKTAALQLGPGARLLHFACHGWLDARDPLSSGLILSQPQALGEEAPVGDNGLLQAWEILSHLKLDADLVVLSACQSGLGQEVRGEGLVGLTRAFTYAGARSMLVSLWEVHDAGTSVLMEAFYTGLKAGQPQGTALREAMRTLHRDRRYRHPYYWSAFVLQGEQ